MENEIEKKYKEYKAWNTISGLSKLIATSVSEKKESQEDKEERKFFNWLFDEMIKGTDNKQLLKEHSRNALYLEFIAFSDSICKEDKSKFFTLPNSKEKIYLNFRTIKDYINDLTNKNWCEFINQLKIKNMNDNISEIEKDLKEISDISQKIIYLINAKSKYETEVAGFSEREKAWLGDTSNFPKQCDALISKYESLLKYSAAPDSKNPAPETKKEFTALKMKEKFDPELVFKEFKEFLKCDIDTFKDWFVNGKESENKMSWKYDDHNKTQLRSFIFEICGGWSPKNTNKAFKITVNSNDRQNNLNSALLKKIEKCKF